MRRFLILVLFASLFAGTLNAQVLTPVKWKVSTKKVSPGVYDIICAATVDAGWHLYDVNLPEGGPLSTSFFMDEDETKGIEIEGKFKATTKAKVEHSDAFEMDLRFFEKEVTFIQRVKLTKAKGKIVGYVEFMACSGGQCIPPGEGDFEFDLEK